MIRELFLYGEIGGEVSARELVTQITEAQADNAPVRLRINSYGGDAFAGMAIFAALRAASVAIPVSTKVDGVAASAASLVAIGAPKTEIVPGAFIMIHNPWSVSVGDATTHRQQADFLGKLAKNVAAIYADRMSLSANEVMRMMTAETWFDDFESLASNLATDRIESTHGGQKPSQNSMFLPENAALSLKLSLDALQISAGGRSKSYPLGGCTALGGERKTGANFDMGVGS